MHGRIKVRTSEEQAEIKRREQQEKLKIYLGVTSKIVSKRAAGEHDLEGLELTGQLLLKNPDFYTLWNYRREILLAWKPDKTVEELRSICLVELDLTQNCLRVSPKSYSAWNHRLWTMEFHPEGDWNRELKLCNYFLSQDERNFHCWDYRRLVAKKCKVSAEEELAYTYELIETNFSNYSAWHYRSKLLPIVYFDSDKGSLKEEVLLKEFDLVENAAFTDPDDSSVRFYHRWLLGRSKTPLELLNISVLKPQKAVFVLFSEPIKVDSDCLTLDVNGDLVPVTWMTITPNSTVASLWKCGLPDFILQVGTADEKLTVSATLRIGEEKYTLSCDLKENVSYRWRNEQRANMFRSELSTAAKDVLEAELESCQSLNELEPNGKWTIFTCVLLMRALNNAKFQKEIESFMKNLTEVDVSRKNYYNDLGSKFVIEDVLETLPLEATEVDLSNRQLTSLCHFEQLILIQKINLSSNNLMSVYPLRHLISVESIILDDNEIASLDGIQELNYLRSLSLKRNSIREPSEIEVLISCSSLQELFLEGNAVLDSEDYVPTLQKLPALKSIDTSSL
ncbi:hypothetical protein JTE90_025833 [Oedothorax gibbosus]|uniref:Geranylgeranyl transferase type-2 subunit alpha n=1 Tax=Oedothorax gibbosus TaxID=931172 RepID=A0AAV6UU50_9ARAC|nr:hypothetical protein JTE90_025833 [Oedothorax gibbosus]